MAVPTDVTRWKTSREAVVGVQIVSHRRSCTTAYWKCLKLERALPLRAGNYVHMYVRVFPYMLIRVHHLARRRLYRGRLDSQFDVAYHFPDSIISLGITIRSTEDLQFCSAVFVLTTKFRVRGNRDSSDRMPPNYRDAAPNTIHFILTKILPASPLSLKSDVLKSITLTYLCKSVFYFFHSVSTT
jgi:hypothetical protein